MKRLKIFCILILVIIIVLEVLPFGAVLNFADPSSEKGYIRATYSYFDLTPFGYANFSPFLCACLSVVLLIYHLIALFLKAKGKSYSVSCVLATVSLLLSITPLMYGLLYYSVIGVTITVFVFILLVLSVKLTSYK